MKGNERATGNEEENNENKQIRAGLSQLMVMGR